MMTRKTPEWSPVGDISFEQKQNSNLDVSSCRVRAWLLPAKGKAVIVPGGFIWT